MRSLFNRNSLLSLISSPLVWGAHFGLCYLIVSLACADAYPDTPLLGIRPVDASIAALTLLSIALLAYIAAVNHGKWQHSRRQAAAAAGIDRFFALCSMMLCALSAVALLWVALPTFVLPACAV